MTPKSRRAVSKPWPTPATRQPSHADSIEGHRTPERAGYTPLPTDAGQAKQAAAVAGAVEVAHGLLVGLAKRSGLDDEAMRAVLAELQNRYREPPPEKAPLPETAPETWASRDLNRRENAPDFIRRVYAPWLGRGLARKDLSKLDPDLYKALSVWLTRHKDDPIVQALPPQSSHLDELIDRLTAEYSLEELRKLGYAINSRLRRGTA